MTNFNGSHLTNEQINDYLLGEWKRNPEVEYRVYAESLFGDYDIKLSVNAVGKRIRRMLENNYHLKASDNLKQPVNANKAEPKLEQSFDVKGDTAHVSKTVDEQVKTKEDLIRVCQIDTTEYDIVAWGCKAWNGFIKNKASEIEKTQLFSVYADLKRRTLQLNVRAELDALLTEMRSKTVDIKPKAVRRSSRESGILLSINLNDLHMGKFSWAKETGADYDVNIAEEMLWSAVEDLELKVKPWNPEKIVLTIGSDLLNVDNAENTTTAGTAQTSDGRYHRTFRRTWQLMRNVIVRLRDLAPVHCVVIGGNHDRNTSFAIGEIIEVAFEGYEDVTVDNTPPSRKYVEWGDCLLGFTHGDQIKADKIPLVMAQECAESWGRTKWRVMETGHIHQQRVTEFPGVVVRINPALCAPEDWHHEKGYIGNIRALHCQVWDKLYGNVAMLSSDPVNFKTVTPEILG